MFKGKSKRNIKLKYKYDNSILNDTIKKIESEVNVTPKDAILKIGPSGKFIVEEEVVGRKLLSDNVDRKSTRLNSSHANISYAVFCLKKTELQSRTYLVL